MLDSQPPNVAAMPGSYEAACKAVAAVHMKEIVDERVQAEVAARTRPANDEEDEDQEEEQSEPRRTVASPTVRSTATGPGLKGKKGRRFEPLSPEERKFAAIAGLSDEEYDRYSHAELTNDIFGFRDKEGRVRDRV